MPGSIDGNTKLVLVNATYFKGDWQFKFDKSKTQKGDFHVSPTKIVQTDMMHSKGEYRMLHSVIDLKGASALDMPYKGMCLSMIFLLPIKHWDIHTKRYKHSSLSDLEKAISKVTDLNSILTFGQKTNVKVTLPRFKLESTIDLIKPLKQLGLTDMFDGRKADFSGMTGGTKSLYVSKAVQKAFVEVNEEGTEAAAATSIIFTSRSSRGPPEFRCDRPFMFLIRDNLTGMILFSGQVTDPTK